jgi:dihydrolipoamide dehydrogenase
VTVVEFLPVIGGPGMDGDISKSFGRILQKQGLKFKLSTKVISAKKNASGNVEVVVEPAAGGAQEKVRSTVGVPSAGCVWN